MTVPTAVRPRPSALQQWWVLTVRSIVPTLRNGELVTAIAASVIFTAGFYIPLKELMGTRHRRDEQLCAVPDTVDRAAGDIVRIHLRGVPGGNRRRPRHQSTIRLHADRAADTVRRPHVGQPVPLRDRFGDRADMWLRHRIPVPPRPGLHRRLLPAGAADRRDAVFARRPDRHRARRTRRPPRRC